MLAIATLLAPPPARAGKADAIERLVQESDFDEARSRCERWEAWGPQEEQAVREACASAFWQAALTRDDQATWAAFREQWKGTDAAARARAQEADAALRDLPARADEQLLLGLFEQYRGTPAGPEFERRAAAAAIRDASTAQAAIAAARRWPGHADLPTLVERFPDAFVQVKVAGRRAELTLDPPVDLSGAFAPGTRWVARNPDGSLEPWDDAARGILLHWGLPDTSLAALPRNDGIPGLPVCHVSGQPSGWQPGVEISIGEGRIFHPVGWDEGCGPDSWPVFLSYEAGRVAGISLSPSHRVDLRETTIDGQRRNTRGYLSAPPGTPLLWNGWIYQLIGSTWMVTPLSGGTPWAMARGPDSSAVPLASGLRGGPLPAGWSVSGGDQSPRVSGPGLSEVPESQRDWRLVPGEVRVPPPLVREVLGLSPERARPPRPPAPALGTEGWLRVSGGALQRQPPTGASVAGIYQLQPAEIDQALAAVDAIGIPASAVKVLDGWRADLDGDDVHERVLRALVDDAGTVLVVDPLTERSGPDQARVFAIETPRVRADARVADTPFTFRKGESTYLAWGGQEVTGPTSRRIFVEVLRSDGASFTVDDIELR